MRVLRSGPSIQTEQAGSCEAGRYHPSSKSQISDIKTNSEVLVADGHIIAIPPPGQNKTSFDLVLRDATIS